MTFNPMQYVKIRHKQETYELFNEDSEDGLTVPTISFEQYKALAALLKSARTEQHKNRFRYGELYSLNYYKQVQEKGRSYCELYSLQRMEEVPENYREIDFVCLRPDRCFESSSKVSIACRTASKKIPGLEGIHFHQLRHTFTSNLLSNGAAPKDAQELMGHADVSTTMNIYAHSTRENGDFYGSRPARNTGKSRGFRESDR